MQMKGEQLLPAPPERVWEALNDPEVIRDCVPGCESLERVSETEFHALLLAAIGPVKAKFTGKLTLSDLDPPRSYRMSFEGSGGATGFAKGSAEVTLAPAEAGTRLCYAASVQVGGKLAQVGSRLIDGVAAKIAGDFFARFRAHFAGTEPVEVAKPADAAARGVPIARLAIAVAALLAIAVVAVLLLR
ncbi:MAG: carbon monoxide dehydrogenase subunit G [Betaproteobacteria bacterium]|nr:carbon monoxide dehydrogenase subunit G [Betaproteobacteria bacterium]